LADKDRRASGEFDGINMTEQLFIEDKSAEGINRVHPKTSLRQSTPEAWAHKHIFEKTAKRIENLQNALRGYRILKAILSDISYFQAL